MTGDGDPDVVCLIHFVFVRRITVNQRKWQRYAYSVVVQSEIRIQVVDVDVDEFDVDEFAVERAALAIVLRYIVPGVLLVERLSGKRFVAAKSHVQLDDRLRVHVTAFSLDCEHR